MAHIIVLGNEKGGSGKSTTAMHVCTALMRSGEAVGVIDLDLRQQSLMAYVRNRRATVEREGLDLPLPHAYALRLSDRDSLRDAQAEEEEAFADALRTLDASCSFVVIDCPGAHTRYAQMAHSAADTLITPMNDSLVDLDLLARLDPATGKVAGPSIYSEMVWSARQLRASAGLPPLDWTVLRNRVGTTDMHNKRRVGDALTELSRRIGFRIVPGFTERVVFRELFLQGLTLLDLGDAGGGRLTISNIAARQELRELIRALNLPGVKLAF
ncbi:AAA family ATPase [Halovulum dunhuangense]|uniref:AAA family ATPase n=1 Tax=Halovulum dunhuangense TaxID=1505036 RepID=A0A849L0B2_9RHOB|nr:division plane positioning ATPase MipZ [Halovulum dunhuangense]NNU79703.1 AAA family ATPase [Halovulum dunhuangense]